MLAVVSKPMSLLWPGVFSLVAWACLAFSAVGPGAVGDVLQSQAQDKVDASQANVLLSSEPLFAALLAMVLLGERMSGTTVAGGGLIIVASLVASGVMLPAGKPQTLKGYLAHKKHPPPRTLQNDYT